MILDTTFPPDPRVENEADSLVKAGHKVFLFCLKYNNNQKDEILNGIEIKRFLSNKFEYKFSALAYSIPVYSFLMKKKVIKFIKENYIEALHVHDIRIAEAVFNANKNYNLPIILDLHDNMPEVIKFYPHMQKFPGKYIISPKKWKIKEEEFIKKADKVISVSPEFLENLEMRNPFLKEKLILVPNTIRTSFFTEYKINNSIIKKYEKDFVILYLGDTHIRRGLQTAIAAIDILKYKIENIKLVIVGKNTTDTILKQQVKDLGVVEYVDFEGWQNVSLFQSYILASQICISPLHRNLQHDFAYANKIFQYMSFEKPILVSDAIAQKRLVENYNTGLIHIDRDVNDFAEKIMILYNNEKLRKDLGENGKKFIENKFTWEKTSKKLINLYDNLSS